MVPTLTWGLVLEYFFLAISCLYEPAVVFALIFTWLHLGLGDELLRKALRQLLIVMELHAVVGPSLGHAAQVRGVAEHGAQRHLGVHDLRRGATLHAEDVPAARSEVAHDVAHELL